ncbi:gamma-glutamylcyclotransferase family protein [Kaarinaea lacus]
MHRLFVYGTLEFPQVVKKVLGTTLVGEYAELPGYERFLLVNRNYPGIIRNSAARVDGVLYHGVTPKQFKLLDRYEDRFYERRKVVVETGHSQIIIAWAYIVPLRYKHELSGKPWDRENFVSIHLKRFLNVRCP